jgi:hypothetical protein
MSWDIYATTSQCDHLQVLEKYTVSPLDFRTLTLTSNTSMNMRAPINAASMLRLYNNRALIAPDHPVYGYSVVPDPTRTQLEGYPFQKIMFNQGVRIMTPLFQASYYTRQGFCLKCNGTGSVPDWVVGPSGSLRHITGEKKLAQQIVKYVMTSVNPFNPTLVCAIRSYLYKKLGVNVNDQDISTAVSKALSAYQSIQQAQKTVQYMDPMEMIQDVVSINVTQDPTNPTAVYLSLVVLAYGSNDAIPLSMAIQTS